MSALLPEQHGYPPEVFGGNIPSDHMPTLPGEWQLRGDGGVIKDIFYGCRAADAKRRREWPHCSVPLKPVQPDGWNFDGNREAPSITPSIDCKATGCGWHGHCTAGVFTP